MVNGHYAQLFTLLDQSNQVQHSGVATTCNGQDLSVYNAKLMVQLHNTGPAKATGMRLIKTE